MRLLDWQSGIQARITAAQPGIEGQIAETRGMHAATRLQVYADAYELRLLDVLRGDFRMLEKAIGGPGFEHFARGYIAAQVSHTASIRWFGRHFADFLRTHASHPAWAAELATFEWAQGEVLDAADAEVCDASALANLPAAAWPDVRLRLHPSLRQLDLEWNIPPLWHAMSSEKAETGAASCPRQSQAWMLWRRELEVHWRSMSAREAKLVGLASQGANCAELCAALHAEGTPAAEVAPLVAGLYKRWLSDGWVSTLQVV